MDKGNSAKASSLEEKLQKTTTEKKKKTGFLIDEPLIVQYQVISPKNIYILERQVKPSNLSLNRDIHVYM